jgi:hypothetical protein
MHVARKWSTNLALSLQHSHQTFPKTIKLRVLCLKSGYFVARLIVILLVHDELKITRRSDCVVDYLQRNNFGCSSVWDLTTLLDERRLVVIWGMFSK